ncbi:hypothetical protein N783_17115, partial [Pontibacillus marinus BH030004 = DSM 16465]
MKIHVVQKGDTLWKISKKYGVNFEELKAMNSQLSNPDMIMPGMKIKVPSDSKPVKKEQPQATQPYKDTSPKPMPVGKEKPKEMPKKEMPKPKKEAVKPAVEEKPMMPAQQPQQPIMPMQFQFPTMEQEMQNYYTTVNIPQMPQYQPPKQPKKEPVKPAAEEKKPMKQPQKQPQVQPQMQEPMKQPQMQPQVQPQMQQPMQQQPMMPMYVQPMPYMPCPPHPCPPMPQYLGSTEPYCWDGMMPGQQQAVSPATGYDDMESSSWESSSVDMPQMPQQGYGMPQQGYGMPHQGQGMPQQGGQMPQMPQGMQGGGQMP